MTSAGRLWRYSGSAAWVRAASSSMTIEVVAAGTYDAGALNSQVWDARVAEGRHRRVVEIGEGGAVAKPELDQAGTVGAVVPGCVDHAGRMPEPTRAIEYRSRQPCKLRSKAGRPQNRAHFAGIQRKAEPRPAGIRHCEIFGRAIRDPVRDRPDVDRREQAFHLQIGKRADVGEGAGKLRPAVPHTRESADDLDTLPAQLGGKLLQHGA